MRTSSEMKLVLEDGTTLRGRAFGTVRAVVGEVVFNTGMTGYVETLTDPSYRGQILVTTYPLVGNYGVPAPREEGSIDSPLRVLQDPGAGPRGADLRGRYSHAAATRSLAQWLEAEGIPAITGIDTRTLTRRLRESGTMKGWLFPADMDVERAKRTAQAVDMRDEVFRSVTPTSRSPIRAARCDPARRRGREGQHRAQPPRARRHGDPRPVHADLAELAKDVDGIMLGNGPGDPKDLEASSPR
jgi:carbamoyl-phosphate synthase small subunit